MFFMRTIFRTVDDAVSFLINVGRESSSEISLVLVSCVDKLLFSFILITRGSVSPPSFILRSGVSLLLWLILSRKKKRILNIMWVWFVVITS